MSEYKGTKGEYKRKGTNIVCGSKNIGTLYNGGADFEPEWNEGLHNAQLLVVAGNIAQKHDPETWELKLELFTEMKLMLKEVKEGVQTAALSHESYQGDLNALNRLISKLEDSK